MARALLAVLLCLASPCVWSATPEEMYLEARNAYLENPAQDALPKLEAQLKAIVGTVAVEGFPGPGKIDLGELYEGEFGFGPADGLTFRNKREMLFVTTRGLLRLHFGETDVTALASDPRIGPSIFAQNATLTRCADVPVTSADETFSAQAFLGTTAQDDGPAPPQLFVFAIRGDRIFAVSAVPTTRFRARFPCQGKAMTSQAAFAEATRQAQAIVDRLQK